MHWSHMQWRSTVHLNVLHLLLGGLKICRYWERFSDIMMLLAHYHDHMGKLEVIGALDLALVFECAALASWRSKDL